MREKIISVLICLCMVMAMPTAGFATVDGKGMSYDNGVLSISDESGLFGWSNNDEINVDDITKIVFEDGVTNIVDVTFNDCKNVTSVEFQGTSELVISPGAFTNMDNCTFSADSAKSIVGGGAQEINITTTAGGDTPPDTNDTETSKPETDPSWPENPFTDVKSVDWFHDSVKYVLDNDLMVGTSGTTFEPNTVTSRGMIVTILYRMEKEPSVEGLENFPDIPEGKWYTDATAWAKAQEISVGDEFGNFGADDNLTREQLATMFYRYAKYKEKASESSTELNFVDSADVSDWAQAAIKWCVEKGIVSGKENNTLDPQGKATRAEMATMISRFVQKINN